MAAGMIPVLPGRVHSRDMRLAANAAKRRPNSSVEMSISDLEIIGPFLSPFYSSSTREPIPSTHILTPTQKPSPLLKSAITTSARAEQMCK